MKRLFLCCAKYVKLVFERHQNGVSTNTVAVKVSKLYNFHSTLKLLSSSFIINLSTFLWRITRGITRINASDFRVYFDLSDVSKYDKGTWDIGLLSSYILFNEVNIGISHNAKLSTRLPEYRSLLHSLQCFSWVHWIAVFTNRTFLDRTRTYIGHWKYWKKIEKKKLAILVYISC